MNKYDVVVMGDIHGDWGSVNSFITKKNPKIILQCGDFGWWPSFEVTKPVLYGQQKVWSHKGIKTKDTDIFFCDGNHEQHTDLIQDGKVYELYDHVYHCSRGSVLLVNGKNVLFVGGADSLDKSQRIPQHDWFYQENITLLQMSMILSIDKKIDIVISHTCPSLFDMHHDNSSKINDPNRFVLDNILEKFKPDLWYFGHWHQYKTGKYKNTKWTCLDYPKHGGCWWVPLS